MNNKMPELSASKIRQLKSQPRSMQPPLKKLKTSGAGSPRLQSLLGAAGVLGLEQQRQKRIQETRTKERKDDSPSEKSNPASEDSPADKMMKFFTGKPCKERSKKSKAIKFPLKLMYVLQCGDFSDIISWTDNGTAFKVVDPSKLEDTVLPAIFKDAKFSSFRRKLNRWAFKRSRTAAYFTVSHPLFRRGDFRMCQMMSCSKADDISFPAPPIGNIDAADHAALLGRHDDPSIAPIMPRLLASSQFGSSSGGYPSEALLGERGLSDSLVGSASSFLQQQQQQRAEAAALMAGGSQKSLLSGDMASTGRRRAGMMAPEENLPYPSFRSNRESLLDNMGDCYGPLAAARSDGRALGYSPLEVSSSAGIRRGLMNNQHLAQHDPSMLSLSNTRQRMIGDFMLNSTLVSPAAEEAAALTRMEAQLEGAPLGGVGDSTTHKNYLRELASVGSRSSSSGRMVDFPSADTSSIMLMHRRQQQQQLFGAGSSDRPLSSSTRPTRKFHSSMEGQRATLARQEDLRRSSAAAAYHATNVTNYHSGESILMAAARRQQWQGMRGDVVPPRRNADRIINDAFNVLQYSS